MYTKLICFLLFLTSNFLMKAQTEKYYGGTDGEKLDWVMYFLKNNYVDTVDSPYLVEKAIKSMMKELDPWSRYQTAQELEDLKNSYKGYGKEAYGFNYFWVGDSLMVTFVSKGGPADLAGLQANDRIIKINDLNANLKNYAPIKIQLHNEDTVLQLSINRPHVFTKPFTLTKAKLPILSVDAAYADSDETAYVKINSFTDNTAIEFKAAIEPLLAKGLQNVIIDLRGNYGGAVTGAIALSDEFLPAGKVISYAKGFNLDRIDYLSTDNYSMKEVSLIILMDELSMSASEMFAGAMQDYDRAIIVGKESYGKGLIQNSFTLNDSSAIRFTTGRYYTPAGRYFDQMVHNNNGFTKLVDSITNEYTIHINLPDSLIDTTLSGRKIVASPKGIVPDIYVDKKPFKTKELILLKGQFLLNTFAFHYMFKNRNELLKNYPTVNKFEADKQIEETLKQELMQFIRKEVEVKQFDKHLIPASITQDIISDVKALIATQAWGNSGYYYIQNKEDALFDRSKAAIKDGSFDLLKVVN